MNKNTSISLGEHFNSFIDAQLSSGRFNSTSEVVRAGLRLLEDNEAKLAELRQRLSEGEEQANRGEFVNYSLDGLKDIARYTDHKWGREKVMSAILKVDT